MKKSHKINKVKLAIAVLVAVTLSISLRSCDQAKQIRQKVVRLHGNGYSCTGEQVRAPSGKDYILSAAHCLVTAVKGEILIITEDGTPIMRKVIEEDKNSDLLLIEGLPNVEGIHIADHSSRFEHVRTFTHGRDLDTYETSGVLIQDRSIGIPVFDIRNKEDMKRCEESPKYKVYNEGFQPMCLLAAPETATSAGIVPGSSGGPVVDDSGDLVGVASATDGYFGYLVRLKDIQNFIYNR